MYVSNQQTFQNSKTAGGYLPGEFRGTYGDPTKITVITNSFAFPPIHRNTFRHLSGYELAENEIFLRDRNSDDWSGFS